MTATDQKIAELEALLFTTEAAYRREKERADRLHTAIIFTLDENGHMADGDNCTLKALKDAVGIG